MTSLLQKANAAFLNVINDTMGKDVTITLKDGVKYTGMLVAISPELSLGLSYAFKITEENVKNLLPSRSEVTEKMQFNFQDIVSIASCITEEKLGAKAMGFATDRDYHGNNLDNVDFEEWNGEEDEGVGGSIEDHEVKDDLPDQRARRNGNGWSVDEMFAANEKMNVVSTFKDDMTQYTTVHVEGSEEDRARADRIAREIEQSAQSKFFARLENDDVERDLDKETGEDDFELVNANNRRPNKNAGYQQNQQQRRNSNLSSSQNGQPINRRADGLKNNDRRNSGGAGNGRYGQQQGFSGGNISQNSSGGSSSSKGVSSNGGNGGGAGVKLDNRRSGNNEEYRDNEWQMSKGKKQMLESRSNQSQNLNNRQQPNQNQPQLSQDSEKQQQGSRVADLKNWKKDFVLNSPSLSTPPPSSHAAVASTQQQQQHQQQQQQQQSMNTGGSAWNRGPPTSLVSKNDSTNDAASSSNIDQQNAGKDRNEGNNETASTSQPTDETDNRPVVNNNDSTITQDSTNADGDNGSNDETITNKSVSSFKFNINAPEFKPRNVPATVQHHQQHQHQQPQQQQMQPTTPTGQMVGQMVGPQGIPIGPQYIHDYAAAHGQMHPHQAAAGPQGGPHLAMQGPPIVGTHMVSNPMGNPLVVWNGAQQQYTQPYLIPVARGPHGPLYTQQGAVPVTTAANALSQQSLAQPPPPPPQQNVVTTSGGGAQSVNGGGVVTPVGNVGGGSSANRRQQTQQQAIYVQQQAWAQSGGPAGAAQMVPISQGFYPQAQYPQGQMGASPYQMANQVGGPIISGPPGQGAYMQQAGQRYGQQQQHGIFFPRYPQGHEYGNQGAPPSHPNSQPPTPGPQGQQSNIQGGAQQQQQQQQQQSNPSGTQNGGGMRQGVDSGSNGSLNGSPTGGSQHGSVHQQRSVSPQQGPPPPQSMQQQHQQGQPTPASLSVPPSQIMQIPPPHQQGQGQPQIPFYTMPPPGQYPHQGQHPASTHPQFYQVFYQPAIYQHGMTNPHSHGQHGQMLMEHDNQNQNQIINQYNDNYDNGRQGDQQQQQQQHQQYYQGPPPPPPNGGMSRQNSLPHQQQQQNYQQQQGGGGQQSNNGQGQQDLQQNQRGQGNNQ